MFWRCAKSPNRSLFNYNRAKLAQKTVEGAADMMNTDPCHWSRAFMKLGSNCDSVDNNMCESFNNYIMESRYLPIVSMLEWIRRKIMVRIQENLISAIYKCSKIVDDFIAPCYSIEAYNRIYDHYLEPLEGQGSWPVADHARPVAPGYIKLPGRPKKERRREEGEAPKGTKMSKTGGKITCGSCNRTGHNMSSCTNNQTATKHHGHAHVARERAKKRKVEKAAFEAENSKKAKAQEDDARQRKGKFAAESSKAAKPSSRKPTSKPPTVPTSRKTAPFVPPKQVSKIPEHCVFNLEAYKAAKKNIEGPPV